MTTLLALPFVGGVLSLILAVASLPRARRTPSTWYFVAGMAALGIESILSGVRLRASSLEAVVNWLTCEFAVKSVVPAIWLGFSLTYSRHNYVEFVRRSKILLLLAAVLPLGIVAGASHQLFHLIPPLTPGEPWRIQFGVMAQLLNVIMLIAYVVILMNLEQTLRAAVGTLRWRIKFAVVALGIIFGVRLYVRIQSILFGAPAFGLWSVESSALLVGCFLLIAAYARTGLAEIDVYPSTSVVRSSLTIFVVGVYLFVVGVLANVVKRVGGPDLFAVQAIVVVLGISGLAVLLLSDRLRRTLRVFVARHFSRAQHDSVRVWTDCSQRLARANDQASVCAAAATLISETFDALSVRVWLVDEANERLVVAASTVGAPATTSVNSVDTGDTSADETASDAVVQGLRMRGSPFDLETSNDGWANEFRGLNATTFAEAGGHRLCVPLRTETHTVGAIVLADRVKGALYTIEDLDLLKCIADQMTSILMNHRLAAEVAQARELDAFRTMSVFLVHDLKNAAASLNLMLRNLPTHFNDPSFREDALRGIGNTATRIDGIIARLSALREQPTLTPTAADLNEIVKDALDKIGDIPAVHVIREFQPLPLVVVDREKVWSVVTNLVLNARDAVGTDGEIRVRTEHRNGRVLLSVTDNGCGMSPVFVKNSLFRPFQSTKRKGLGIGLFQSRAIVQAHGGGIQVNTEVGRGTTFLVSLPAAGAQ